MPPLSCGIFNFHFVISVSEHLAVDTDCEAMTFIPPLAQLSHSIDLAGGQRIDHAGVIAVKRRACNTRVCWYYTHTLPKAALDGRPFFRQGPLGDWGRLTGNVDEDALYRAFGKAIANRRRQIGLTQAQLAEAVGLSRGSIAHIERGSQKVFLHQILALTDALQLESSHMLVPTRAIMTSGETSARVKTFGAKDLSADQRNLVGNIVSRTTEKKVN